MTGTRVQLTTSGTLPGGLAAATNYYVIVVEKITGNVVEMNVFDNEKSQHNYYLDAYNSYDDDYNVQKMLTE